MLTVRDHHSDVQLVRHAQAEDPPDAPGGGRDMSRSPGVGRNIPTPSPAASPVTPRSDCLTYTIYTLRGSGETEPITAPVPDNENLSGLGGSGLAFFNAYKSAVAPSESVELKASKYPAVSVDGIPNVPAYFDSVTSGRNQAGRDLAKIRAECPDTRIFAVGYS
jgi:hypothetical protein